MRTLRQRFVLSHVLPLLIILPLMGIALVYVLETQVLLGSLARGLKGQALLIARITREQTDIWNDPVQAQAFVSDIAPQMDARLMLLDLQGGLLASSDSADGQRLDQPFKVADWPAVLAGETIVHTIYSRHLQTEIVDVLVPVTTPDRQVVGVVRLSHQLTSVVEQFLHLRYLIAGVLAAGLFLGAVVGWLLALNLERPLRHVTQTVQRLASGDPSLPLLERGPQEILQLLHSVNVLAERLQSVEQARHQLLSNLVHELGRPLGALRSAIQALLGRSGEDAALRQELLVGMDQEVNHLGRLVDDLAGHHDQVWGTLELDLRPTDLSDWLSHMLSPWREAALAQELSWQATIPAALPTLEVDPDRLGQAVGNLLSNALKYTPRKGTVSVAAGVKDSAIWIRVSDTGPGIAAEEQDRIFAPFYRSQGGRRFPQGMGLGLSIAHTLVAAHGGRLEVESTPGLGSHFTIWIPLQDPAR